jgi:tyrosine aminotransferase
LIFFAGDMVYDNAVFHPLATLSPKVPILTCDGIAKRFLVPGWRLGWLIIYDPVRALGHVRDGLRNLAQKIVGPCAVSCEAYEFQIGTFKLSR